MEPWEPLLHSTQDGVTNLLGTPLNLEGDDPSKAPPGDASRSNTKKPVPSNRDPLLRASWLFVPSDAGTRRLAASARSRKHTYRLLRSSLAQLLNSWHTFRWQLHTFCTFMHLPSAIHFLKAMSGNILQRLEKNGEASRRGGEVLDYLEERELRLSGARGPASLDSSRRTPNHPNQQVLPASILMPKHCTKHMKETNTRQTCFSSTCCFGGVK